MQASDFGSDLAKVLFVLANAFLESEGDVE